MLTFDILTLFPKMFDSVFEESIIKRAKDKGLVEIRIHNLRKWAKGKYKKVDDTPYGGGGGMVLMIEPVHEALKEIKTKDSIVIALTAKGDLLKQSTVNQIVEKTNNKNFPGRGQPLADKLETKNLVLLCGHYEGFDQRILDNLVDYQISVGNYVLTGGEIPAMILIDAITRLLPGAVGNEETPKTDSYYQDDQKKQYPIYTKPEEYNLDGKILKVPDVLVSGDHERIREWRQK